MSGDKGAAGWLHDRERCKDAPARDASGDLTGRTVVAFSTSVSSTRGRVSASARTRARALRHRAYTAAYDCCVELPGGWLVVLDDDRMRRLEERVRALVDDAAAFNAEDLGLRVDVAFRVARRVAGVSLWST